MGDHAPNDRIIHEGVGVVGMITPWNFPSSMLARKIGPALSVGCTVVAKPATATPYSGLAWAALTEEVGFPKGVLNVVTGSARKIAGAMMDSPAVRKITFTGSTEVGKELIRQSADTVKKVSMELGGNAPFIVFDDADLDAAADNLIANKFRGGGQTCVCANRIYVQSGIYDEFAKRLKAKVEKLTIGDGLEDGTDLGPLINADAIDKVQEHLKDATSKGAKVILGDGKPMKLSLIHI